MTTRHDAQSPLTPPAATTRSHGGSPVANSSGPSRRGFLVGLSVAPVVVSACTGDTQPRTFEPDTVPEDLGLFPRTVIAGEMKPTSVMLAIYYAGSLPIRVRMWKWQGGLRAAQDKVEVLVDERCTPDADGFVKLRVEDLEPGERYGYVFLAGDEPTFAGRSLVGRVRAALAEGALEPLTVGWAACTGHGLGLAEYVNPDTNQPIVWDSMTLMGSLELDVFLHVGDELYFDKVYNRGGGYAEYLAGWGAGHGGGYRDVYPNQGGYFTWDDHEVTDNGVISPYNPTEEQRTRVNDALRAWFTVHPVEGDSHATPLWRSFRWGATAEFFITDGRYDDKIEGENYWSPQQEEFILAALKASPCRFKLLINSAPLAIMPPDTLEDHDRWSKFAQRQRVLDFIDAHGITGVVSVSGDVHTNYVGQLNPDPATASEGIPEVCVTSGNVNILGDKFVAPNIDWAYNAPAVPTLRLDPIAGTVAVTYRALDGSVVYETTLHV